MSHESINFKRRQLEALKVPDAEPSDERSDAIARLQAEIDQADGVVPVDPRDQRMKDLGLLLDTALADLAAVRAELAALRAVTEHVAPAG
jgi:hypothetical protein